VTRLPACPLCGGPRLPDHPGGLVIRHRQRCRHGLAELARQAADADEARTRVGPWLRPATWTERNLLESVGVQLSAEPMVEVLYLTPSVRRRTFTDARGEVVDLDADASPEAEVNR